MISKNFLIILHLVSTTKTIKETGKVKLKDDFLLEPRRMIKLFIAMKSFLHLQLFPVLKMYFMCECISNNLLPSSNSYATSSSSPLTYEKLIAQTFAFYPQLQIFVIRVHSTELEILFYFLLQISCDAILIREK